jgi:HEAT repeat protein
MHFVVVESPSVRRLEMIHALSIFLLCISPQDDVSRARAFVQKLNSDDVQEREGAEHELKRLSPRSAEVDQVLEKFTREGPLEVRGRVLSILEERRLIQHAAKFVSDPEEFVARLRSGERNVRLFAFQRVQRLGADGAPFAAEYLKAGDEFASEALRIVGLSGDPRYIAKVRGLLQVPNLRSWAFDALSRLGDSAIRPDLHQLVTNPEAIRQLGRLRHPDDIELFGRLVRDDQATRSEAALLALHGWTQAQKQLNEAILDRVRDQSGTAILLALELRDPRLLGAIKGFHERPEAIFARAALRDESVVPDLLRVAKYGPQVRLGLWGLGVLKARGAMEQLYRGRAQAGEQSTELRHALESVLEDYEVWDNQGAHTFRKKDSLFVDRRGEIPMALWALGESGGTEAERLAREALQDRNEAIRYGACEALGRMRSLASVPSLIKALDDALAFTPLAAIPTPPKEGENTFAVFSSVTQANPDKGWAEVRQAATQALEAITGERFEGTTDERIAAWRAWAGRRGDK